MTASHSVGFTSPTAGQTFMQEQITFGIPVGSRGRKIVWLDSIWEHVPVNWIETNWTWSVLYNRHVLNLFVLRRVWTYKYMICTYNSKARSNKLGSVADLLVKLSEHMAFTRQECHFWRASAEFSTYVQLVSGHQGIKTGNDHLWRNQHPFPSDFWRLPLRGPITICKSDAIVMAWECVCWLRAYVWRKKT